MTQYQSQRCSHSLLHKQARFLLHVANQSIMRMRKCVNTCFNYPDRKASCSLFLDYWFMKMAAIKHVAFVEDTAHCLATEETDDTDISDSDNDFIEIIMSEAESLATSDEEDAELLEVAYESAYSYNPALFSKRTLDPAERSSLLLLDKDFLDNELSFPTIYDTFIWVSVSKPHLIMLIRFDLQLAYFGKHGRGVHFSAFIKPGKTDHVQ